MDAEAVAVVESAGFVVVSVGGSADSVAEATAVTLVVAVSAVVDGAAVWTVLAAVDVFCGPAAVLGGGSTNI